MTDPLPAYDSTPSTIPSHDDRHTTAVEDAHADRECDADDMQSIATSLSGISLSSYAVISGIGDEDSVRSRSASIQSTRHSSRATSPHTRTHLRLPSSETSRDTRPDPDPEPQRRLILREKTPQSKDKGVFEYAVRWLGEGWTGAFVTGMAVAFVAGFCLESVVVQQPHDEVLVLMLSERPSVELNRG